MKEQINKNIAIAKLNSILEWSDRLGSDEIHEISTVIKLLSSES